MTWWVRSFLLIFAASNGGCSILMPPTASPLPPLLPLEPMPVAAAPASPVQPAALAEVPVPLPPPKPVEAPAAEPPKSALPQLAPLPAADPAAGPTTLAEFEELTDRVHPTMRRDRAQIESGRGTALQAGLFPNPRFDTNNPQVINGRNTTLNAGFQVEIPVAGKKKLDRSAALEGVRQAEVTYAQNRAAIHAAVRQQFYAVLVDQERNRVLGRMSEIARQSYEAGQRKKQAGEATEIDVRLLLVALQRSEATLRSAAAILEGDKKQLEAIVGAPNVIRGPLVGPITGRYPEFDAQALIERVTRNHTQIEYAQSVIRQTRTQLRRAEVEPYPNPYLGPAYQFGLIPGNDQFWFNIQFAIPVWDQNQGNIRAAKANVAAAIESVDVSRLNLVNQAENLLSQYRAARAVVERYESGVLENANEAARLVREGYARGVIDRGTLLSAQQSAAQANSDYVDALQSLWSNATQLSGLLQQESFPEPARAEGGEKRTER